MAIDLTDDYLKQLEKESSTRDPIPEGTICDFEVIRDVAFGDKVKYTENRTSSTNKPMLQAVLNVFYEGKPRVIIVYPCCSPTAHPYEKKIMGNLARSLGITSLPDSFMLKADDIIGKGGKLIVGIESSEQYGDKNIVSEYLPKAVEVDLDDEIPFA